MKIDFANLNLAYSENKQKIDDAISRILNSSSFIMGEEIGVLENKLKKFTDSKYVISCSSGTDALLLSLMAINIKPGDEIITTPFSFISTAEVIALLGAKPVFVDINYHDYNINSYEIEKKITPKTKAIIPVSLYGQVSDMNKINDLAKKYNLIVIEDAAQSFGAKYYDKRSCNLSDLACTSFFPAKPLGCFGDGGAVFTNNEEFAEKISSLRLHGQTKRYFHKYIGIGGRLDTLQAAILNVKMDNYEKNINRRNKVANYYENYLKNFISTPKIDENKTSVWAQYTIRLKNREYVIEKLKENGIPTSIHYPRPLHLQECFSYLDYKIDDFPCAEEASNQVLSLPMNPYLTDEQINYICTNLLNFIE